MTWMYSPAITLLMMLPLVSFYSFSLDLFGPLLPIAQNALNSSIQAMHYTNSLFMLFVGIGQLFFGPLSDRYGRLPTLYISMLFFIIGNYVSYITLDYSVFLFSRILQAIGACGSYLCCFATIRDLFCDENEATAMFSYLNIANSVSAIIAPTIGSNLAIYFGWKSIFAVLAGVSMLSLVNYAILATETAPKPKQCASLPSILNNYYQIFIHPNYQLYTLPAALGFGSYFSFYSIGPYLYTTELAFDNLSYSYLYGTLGITFFIGSYVCAQLILRLGIYATLMRGLAIHAFGCIYLLLGYYFFGLNIWMIHPAIICIIAGSSLMIAAGIGGTMAPFDTIAGAAFAMISFYKFLAAMRLSDLVMYFYDGTPKSLAICLLAFNLVSIALLLRYSGYLQSQRPATDVIG